MWRSLKKSRPYRGIRVKIKHMTTGSGAPERCFEDWESTGIYQYDGKWCIWQNDSIKSKNIILQPTHWDYMPKETKFHKGGVIEL